MCGLCNMLRRPWPGRRGRLLQLVLLATGLLAPSAIRAQGPRPYVAIGATSSYVQEQVKAEGQWRLVRGQAERRTDFLVGGGFTYPVLGPFSARGELSLSRRGFSDNTVDLILTYLELPLLAQFGVPLAADRTLRFSVGVAPAWEVGCHADAAVSEPDRNDGSSSARQALDCSLLRSEQFDWGVTAGIGYGPLPLGGVLVTPELRLVVGQVNLAREYAACCWSRNRALEVLATVTR